MEENDNSFMIECFTAGLLQLREDIEKPCNFAQKC